MTLRFRLALCILLAVLLLSACEAAEQPLLPTIAPTGSAAPDPTPAPAASARPAPAEAYAEVLENCYAVLYADWYRPLTAEDLIGMDLCPLMLSLGADADNFGCFLRDLNGDDLAELFLGLNEPGGSGVLYELFTVRGGSAVSLYTVTEGDALYLCRDNTLLQEGMSADGSIYLQRYSLNGEGLVDALGGLYYKRNSGDGPYFSVAADGSTAPIGEAEFLDVVSALEAKRESCRYTTFLEQSREEGMSASAPADGLSDDPGIEDGAFERRSLYDPRTGVRAADVLVPAGWSAALELNWQNMSAELPGTAAVTLTSPDAHAVMRLRSERAFYDVTSDGAQLAEGEDRAHCRTLLHYRDAETLQLDELAEAGLADAVLLRALPVPDALMQQARQRAEAKLEGCAAALSTPLGSEGTVARNLYRCGDSFVECLTLVSAAQTRSPDGGTDTIAWSVPLSCLLIADSEQSWAQLRGVFETVIVNSGFTAEFQTVNARFGEMLAELIPQGEEDRALSLLAEQSGVWLREYAASPSYQAGVWADRWSGLTDAP